MFRYGHRLSKDIDIFVPDPLVPRLRDAPTQRHGGIPDRGYTEMPGSFVKLQFEEGEIDFVAAPNLTDAAWGGGRSRAAGARRDGRGGDRQEDVPPWGPCDGA